METMKIATGDGYIEADVLKSFILRGRKFCVCEDGDELYSLYDYQSGRKVEKAIKFKSIHVLTNIAIRHIEAVPEEKWIQVTKAIDMLPMINIWE